MKKSILVFILFFGIQSFLFSNPIDVSPIACFSELVFGINNNWTMELFFPSASRPGVIDSIIFKVSNNGTKLINPFEEGSFIRVITSDNLSSPIVINREGDEIEILTYSNHSIYPRQDILIYGNYPGASVGSASFDYSAICRVYGAESIDCLSKTSSLGEMNNAESLSATMHGSLYDVDNNLVTQIKSPYFLKLDRPLIINSDGTYTTKIFRKFPVEVKEYISALVQNIEALSDTVRIEPFELNDVHPDTIVVQDIHLRSNKFVIAGVEDVEPIRNDELALINYPNPFNLSTNFFVKIPDQMKGKEGGINIYNATGQLIKVIELTDNSTLSWDGRDKNNSIMPSGIYYYQLTIENQMMKSGSMILLK